MKTPLEKVTLAKNTVHYENLWSFSHVKQKHIRTRTRTHKHTYIRTDVQTQRTFEINKYSYIYIHTYIHTYMHTCMNIFRFTYGYLTLY
jgi:hypothetical protein